MNANPEPRDDDNPYRAPSSSEAALREFSDEGGTPATAIYRDGDLLVFTRDAVLPDICLRTNRCDVVRWTQTLHWTPAWVSIGIPLGIIPYVVLSSFLTQHVEVTLPFASRLIAWWRVHVLISTLIVLGAFALMIADPFLGAEDPKGILLALSWSTMLAGFAWALWLVPLVQTHRISARHVWLRGVHRDYLGRWPQFPGE